MTNVQKSLKTEWAGAIYCAALEVYLVESVLAGPCVTSTPFIQMDQTSRNGP